MVMDASALLAFFNQEPGMIMVASELEGDISISAVTYTEVIGKIVSAGGLQKTIEQDLLDLRLEPIAFDTKQAKMAAYFYARRKPYNLSLGDCATLALAEVLGEAVITAEKRWAELPDLKIEVRLIR
jgi:PIN domain nuclease of toxin-antitoxin system